MLQELSISRFAVIEEQSVTFGPGLNVISGETGAGKSVILSAMELILGSRPRPGSVREGAPSLEVHALFDLTPLHPSVVAELPDVARGDELVLARTVTSSGKGKVYVNGKLATVALLEEIAGKLINICGQSQHVRLLEPSYHLALVDDYAAHSGLVSSYASAYSAWKEASDRLVRAEETLGRSAERRIYLETVVAELSGVRLAPGVRASLEERIGRLANREKLLTALGRVSAAVTDEGGLADAAAAVGAAVAEVVRSDAGAGALAAAFASVTAGVDETDRVARSLAASIEVDDEALESLREELAEVARLERKYRTSDAGLAERLASATAELALLSDPAGVDVLRADEAAAARAVAEAGEVLSASRRDAGRSLSSVVGGELAELNMKGAGLSLELSRTHPGPTGIDRGELLLAPTKGAARRPLRQIASGGELSRILLVLKKVLRDRSGVNVLVFDEVDAGVSGGVARAVGEKLRALARESQVICITHLPQVASLADTHLKVVKTVSDTARSTVTLLSESERVDEVARMIAGHTITEAARTSARELLTRG